MIRTGFPGVAFCAPLADSSKAIPIKMAGKWSTHRPMIESAIIDAALPSKRLGLYIPSTDHIFQPCTDSWTLQASIWSFVSELWIENFRSSVSI